MEARKYLTVLAVWLASCSVLEERAGCPCRLAIDLSAYAPFGRYAEVAVWNGPDAFQETAPAAADWSRDITKGEVLASAWTGQRDGHLSGTQFIVPQGKEPDSLRVWSQWLDCRDEICRVKALPHKQYARVTIRFAGADLPWPYQLYVESDCCGIDLEDLSPLAGDRIFPVGQAADGSFRFDLLRHHAGTTVSLGLYEDTERADVLPLSEWMRKSGYDWEAEDLADIAFAIDYARSRVLIEIAGWAAGDSLEIDL
ncbi:MAG: hypothetical protein J6P46_07255 [Bacteroidales bacterium]|nr:hypothetical protein [Bacteroidales bacterium]